MYSPVNFLVQRSAASNGEQTTYRVKLLRPPCPHATPVGRDEPVLAMLILVMVHRLLSFQCTSEANFIYG